MSEEKVRAEIRKSLTKDDFKNHQAEALVERHDRLARQLSDPDLREQHTFMAESIRQAEELYLETQRASADDQLDADARLLMREQILTEGPSISQRLLWSLKPSLQFLFDAIPFVGFFLLSTGYSYFFALGWVASASVAVSAVVGGLFAILAYYNLYRAREAGRVSVVHLMISILLILVVGYTWFGKVANGMGRKAGVVLKDGKIERVIPPNSLFVGVPKGGEQVVWYQTPDTTARYHVVRKFDYRGVVARLWVEYEIELHLEGFNDVHNSALNPDERFQEFNQKLEAEIDKAVFDYCLNGGNPKEVVTHLKTAIMELEGGMPLYTAANADVGFSFEGAVLRD